jgi:hypothetical protein
MQEKDEIKIPETIPEITEVATALVKCSEPNIAKMGDMFLSGMAFDKPDSIGMLYSRLQSAKQFLAMLSKLIEAGTIAYIQENGEFEDMGIRYYVGPDVTIKCRDVGIAFDQLLTVLDLDSVKDLLAAGAWKPAAVRDALKDIGKEEMYDVLFDEKAGVEVKTGKPRRVLNRVDKQFAKNRVTKKQSRDSDAKLLLQEGR